VTKRFLFHVSPDGSEAWHLVVKEDDTHWVRYSTRSGETSFTSVNRFLMTISEEDPRVGALRAAIAKAVTFPK
jgi:hypothetical protein